MTIKSYLIEYEQIDRFGGNIYGEDIVPATSYDDALQYYRELYPRRKVVDCIEQSINRTARPNAWKIDEMLQEKGVDLEARKLIFNTLTACTFIDLSDID